MDNRVQETVWEYRRQALGADKRPQGPSTSVSRGHSFIRIQDNDPEAQYDACEFGNNSSHDIAFRVTKTSGLVFVPNQGVLKPGENVPLRFKLPTGRKSPACAEVEVLAIRVNESDTSRKIENKWQHVPSDKISRTRWMQMAVFGLAVLMVGVAYWLHSLDRRLKDIEEHCKGIFYWFSPFCHQD